MQPRASWSLLQMTASKDTLLASLILFRVSLASHQIIYRPTYYAGGRVEQEDLLFLGVLYEVGREVVRQAKPAGTSAELVAVTS